VFVKERAEFLKVGEASVYLPLVPVSLEVPDMNLILNEIPRGPCPFGDLDFKSGSFLRHRFFLFFHYHFVQHRAVSQFRLLTLVQVVINHLERGIIPNLHGGFL
jgi:hypothetical protein